ncbi:solute carrier family 25 member 53 [Latimeria chalumnae]|uniref:Solute carrier family 25 member 53 n=1 Tax=Latimeria chalumnae TaxID=7897 RepID=H3A558_LATCH|nr:PREDICTED: solute carrier family 25 member 53 [Latimeria chalumnae]|eukprot:XP_006001374.1 PREDICTED: solute carrier family 25 member 53 [Latimeria chalumnae]
MPENHSEASASLMRTTARSYAFGAVSSFFATFVTFPIYKTIFRQQLHALVIREAVDQLHNEGFLKFYRGILPPLLAKTIQGTLLFGTHDTLLQWMSHTTPDSYSLKNRCVAGFLSGTMEAVVLCPFERVQNILQDSRKDSRFPNIRSILQEFNSYREKEKLTLGYYRGFLPVLLRNGMGSALYFAFKDPIKNSLSEKGLTGSIPAFISGSVNGIVVCLTLYPLSVLIVTMQSQVKGEMLNIPDSFSALWNSRRRKLSHVYRGGSLIVLRSCITWGLTTAIYDFLKGNMNGET